MTPKEWLQITESYRDAFFQYPSDIFKGLEYSKNYSALYSGLVSKVASDISEKIFGKKVPTGLAVYSFGAPARNELFGSSDADVIIYKEKNNSEITRFSEQLRKCLDRYGFSKVDMPEWGSFDDVACYCGTSVTEANQVMESRFIFGDINTKKGFEKLRKSKYDQSKIARNLLFQFFYFDQYFDKKLKEGQVNLKYSHAGTRNTLFYMWYSQLKNGISSPSSTASEEGLDLLYDEGRISADERLRILEGVSTVSFLRDCVMRTTPKDMDGIMVETDLLFLDKHQPLRYLNNEGIKRMIDSSRANIQLGKSKVWEGLIEYLIDANPPDWKDNLKQELSGDWTRSSYKDDEILNTIKVWNIKERSVKAGTAFERLSDTDSWIVLASLLSNEYCSGEVIDYIIRNKAVNHGYEYFLEIATRNMNTQNETLEFIVGCDKIESRFKKAAKQKLKEANTWAR